jgi:hypothetical protein
VCSPAPPPLVGYAEVGVFWLIELTSAVKLNHRPPPRKPSAVVVAA